MKLICTQDFFMLDSTELAFKEGNVYDIKRSERTASYVIEADEKGGEHFMDDEDMDKCFCLSHWIKEIRSTR